MNFTRTVTIELEVYQSMEKQIAELAKKVLVFDEAVTNEKYQSNKVDELTHQVNRQLEKISELKQDNERLTRIVDGLQVQHRNDQGLD